MDENKIFDKFIDKFGGLLSKLEVSLFGIKGGEDGFIVRTDNRLTKIEQKIEDHDKIYDQAPEVFAMVKAHDKIMEVVNLFQRRNWRFIAGIVFVLSWIGYAIIKAFIFVSSFIFHK